MRHALLLLAVLTAQLTAKPALAADEKSGVFSQAAYDSYLYVKGEPYGEEYRIYGPPANGGWLQPAAAAAATNPSFSDYQGQWLWSVAGFYSAQAATAIGVNRAWSRAQAGQATTEGTPQVLASGLSLWYDRITVTGGQGSGTLAFTARLDGTISIEGTPTSEDQVGTGGAWLNFLTTSQLPTQFIHHPLNQGLAFPCAAGADDCDYNPTIFKSVGDIGIETGSSTNFDKSHTFTVDFEYGVPFYLIGVLETGAVTFAADAVVVSDFMHTARFTAVEVPQGGTVLLGSGKYDAYMLPTPVPEPGSWALMAAGLAGLLAWQRRARV